MTSLVAGYVLSDLARLRRTFPEVEVRATEDNGDFLQHLLIGGELDVAAPPRSATAPRCRWRRCGCRLPALAAARPPAGRRRGDRHG